MLRCQPPCVPGSCPRMRGLRQWIGRADAGTAGAGTCAMTHAQHTVVRTGDCRIAFFAGRYCCKQARSACSRGAQSWLACLQAEASTGGQPAPLPARYTRYQRSEVAVHALGFTAAPLVHEAGPSEPAVNDRVQTARYFEAPPRPVLLGIDPDLSGALAVFEVRRAPFRRSGSL